MATKLYANTPMEIKLIAMLTKPINQPLDSRFPQPKHVEISGFGILKQLDFLQKSNAEKSKY